MTTWSAQQEQALAEVREWVKDKHGAQIFRLFGFAGTGKTTLAKEIAGMVKKPRFGAFTGKAASVMRKKGCDDAQTIHSLIYKIKPGTEHSPEPEFILSDDSEIKECDLVIIDECSMIGEEMGQDLLSFGKKILVIGDPAQLPPIKGAGFFTEAEPDFMLTEVHRQARDNPIIALSMLIREGGKIEGQYGGGLCRIISQAEITPEEILSCDQVLVGLNRTRHRYNGRIRELLERPPLVPVRADKLICLRNDRKKGIYNGSLWAAESVKRGKKDKKIFHMLLRSLDDDSEGKRGVQTREEFFAGTDAEMPWQEKRGTQEFTFGYAITCHKAQGSQYDNLIVFDESGAFREDARRWRYTAVTRAAERLTLVI